MRSVIPSIILLGKSAKIKFRIQCLTGTPKTRVLPKYYIQTIEKKEASWGVDQTTQNGPKMNIFFNFFLFSPGGHGI